MRGKTSDTFPTDPDPLHWFVKHYPFTLYERAPYDMLFFSKTTASGMMRGLREARSQEIKRERERETENLKMRILGHVQKFTFFSVGQ